MSAEQEQSSLVTSQSCDSCPSPIRVTSPSHATTVSLWVGGISTCSSLLQISLHGCAHTIPGTSEGEPISLKMWGLCTITSSKHSRRSITRHHWQTPLTFNLDCCETSDPPCIGPRSAFDFSSAVENPHRRATSVVCGDRVFHHVRLGLCAYR